MTGESTGGSGHMSGGSSRQSRVQNAIASHKTFSRQNVISACEKAAPRLSVSESESSDSSHSTSSESGSSTSSGSSDTSGRRNEDHFVGDDDRVNPVEIEEDTEVEIDEFGDVVPPHLRKKNRRKKSRQQVYDVQQKEKERMMGIVAGADEDGWTTDF